MNKKEYFALADSLALEAGVQNGIHSSFIMHRDRLWTTISHFDLWKLRDKDVLEIGAFYGYTPFVLHQNDNRVTVIEGDDPIVYDLKPLYAKRGIDLVFADFVDTFGDPDTKKHRLPFADNQFDVITCWETMEHFSFNPVGFVKEVHRVLKPGGIITLTVPNRAKLHHRIRMAIGRPMGETAAAYYHFYNYPRRFMGWHWREYTLKEFAELFVLGGFSIVAAKHLAMFQFEADSNLLRKLKHSLIRMACAAVPSLATNCALVARK
jgi:SAM-dependent methyltransferase